MTAQNQVKNKLRKTKDKTGKISGNTKNAIRVIEKISEVLS